MDIAYDHIQEESFSPHSEHPPSAEDGGSQPQNLSTEFQQAYKAVSSSPWGMKLGGWFGEAKKQGEAFYSDLQKEANEAQTQATKGFEGLRDQLAQRTRGMSLNAPPGPESSIPGVEAVPESNKKGKQPEVTIAAEAETKAADRPESLPADIVKEAGSLVASFRNTAAAKLKDLQKAEDAADEALLKFGANVRNFLRDAVVITAPTEGDASKPKGTDAAGNEVLFETTEQSTGRKVFHTTRLDAQLHAIHTQPARSRKIPKASNTKRGSRSSTSTSRPMRSRRTWTSTKSSDERWRSLFLRRWSTKLSGCDTTSCARLSKRMSVGGRNYSKARHFHSYSRNFILTSPRRSRHRRRSRLGRRRRRREREDFHTPAQIPGYLTQSLRKHHHAQRSRSHLF